MHEVEFNAADRAIIEALLKLGETIGFKVVLEGVETVEQRDLLRSMGCRLAQGYFYAAPVPAADVLSLIAQLNGAQMSNAQDNQDQSIKAA